VDLVELLVLATRGMRGSAVGTVSSVAHTAMSAALTRRSAAVTRCLCRITRALLRITCRLRAAAGQVGAITHRLTGITHWRRVSAARLRGISCRLGDATSRPSRDYSSGIPDYSSSIPDYSPSHSVYPAPHCNCLPSRPHSSLICARDRSSLRRIFCTAPRLLALSSEDAAVSTAMQCASTASNAPSCCVRSSASAAESCRCRGVRRTIRVGLARRFSASFARSAAMIVARIGQLQIDAW
jgi:hypothetical protein